MIHEAIKQALVQKPERAIDDKLWVSDLGKNPYSACKRLMNKELEEFDYATLLKMDAGTALEHVSLRQIAENLPARVTTQFPLYNEIWTGYADIVIGHGTDDVYIFDHKGSAGRWWDYKESLPRASDCCQVWMYGQLYQAHYGVKPKLGLYYRGWGTWAEFDLKFFLNGRDGAVVHATGRVTDDKGKGSRLVTRERRLNPLWLREELESYHNVIHAGVFRQSSLDDLNPQGPDWDYAENSYDRLAVEYGGADDDE